MKEFFSLFFFKRYTDLYSDSNDKALTEEHRDTLLEILSDARVTAPLVQAGLYLSKVNPDCYMYVFSHNSEAGEYARVRNNFTKKSGVAKCCKKFFGLIFYFRNFFVAFYKSLSCIIF